VRFDTIFDHAPLCVAIVSNCSNLAKNLKQTLKGWWDVDPKFGTVQCTQLWKWSSSFWNSVRRNKAWWHM